MKTARDDDLFMNRLKNWDAMQEAAYNKLDELKLRGKHKKKTPDGTATAVGFIDPIVPRTFSPAPLPVARASAPESVNTMEAEVRALRARLAELESVGDTHAQHRHQQQRTYDEMTAL